MVFLFFFSDNQLVYNHNGKQDMDQLKIFSIIFIFDLG